MRPAIDLTVKVTVYGAESATHAAAVVQGSLGQSLGIDTNEIYLTDNGEVIYEAVAA